MTSEFRISQIKNISNISLLNISNNEFSRRETVFENSLFNNYHRSYSSEMLFENIHDLIKETVKKCIGNKNQIIINPYSRSDNINCKFENIRKSNENGLFLTSLSGLKGKIMEKHMETVQYISNIFNIINKDIDYITSISSVHSKKNSRFSKFNGRFDSRDSVSSFKLNELKAEDKTSRLDKKISSLNFKGIKKEKGLEVINEIYGNMSIGSNSIIEFIESDERNPDINNIKEISKCILSIRTTDSYYIDSIDEDINVNTTRRANENFCLITNLKSNSKSNQEEKKYKDNYLITEPSSLNFGLKLYEKYGFSKEVKRFNKKMSFFVSSENILNDKS